MRFSVLGSRARFLGLIVKFNDRVQHLDVRLGFLGHILKVLKNRFMVSKVRVFKSIFYGLLLGFKFWI
jgi:hypothetical protein